MGRFYFNNLINSYRISRGYSIIQLRLNIQLTSTKKVKKAHKFLYTHTYKKNSSFKNLLKKTFINSDIFIERRTVLNYSSDNDCF